MTRTGIVRVGAIACVAVGGFIGAVNRVDAAVIVVANAGFEDSILGDGGFNNTGIPSWTTTSPAGTLNPNVTMFATEAPEGNNTAFAGSEAQISQVLADTLDANITYTLDVEVGDRLDTTMRGYQVQLLAGGNLLAQSTSPVPGEGAFVTSNVTYTSTDSDVNLGSPLEIRLIGLGQQVNFDDVRLNAVPEPATCLLLTAGLLAILPRRRRGGPSRA